MSGKIIAYVRLSRPFFLGGGVVMYGLGVTMALYRGDVFDWWAYLWGQLAVTSIQAMTHFANEYFDLETDRANTSPTFLTGGSRVLPDGDLPPRSALVAAGAACLAAITFIVILAITTPTDSVFLFIFAAMLILAWGYSAPPFRFHSRGLGELTATTVMAGLTPVTGYLLQTGTLDGIPFTALIPLACFQLSSMMAVAFPDIESDAATAKNTLVVRLRGGAPVMHNLFLLLGYVVLPVLYLAGMPGVAVLAVALTTPLGIWQAWRARKDWRDPLRRGWLAAGGVATLMSASVLEALAFGYLWIEKKP